MNATVAPFVRELRLGDEGPDVYAVKRALIKAGDGEGIVLSTVLGAAADADIRLFQKQHGLTADGVYGPATHKALAPYFDAYGISLLEKELAAMYRSPYRDVVGLFFDGYDQGVDFAGHGYVYAAGPAVVKVSTTHSGWPGGGAVSYTLTSGIAKGKAVYFTENITPLVYVGQTVTARTAIAVLHASFPHCESGWAEDGTAIPLSQPLTHGPTHYGVNFGDFLISIGEHRCPHQSAGGGPQLPSGWPRWLLV